MKNVTLTSGKTVGMGYPCYIIAEIGINHNGDIEMSQSSTQHITVHLLHLDVQHQHIEEALR